MFSIFKLRVLFESQSVTVDDSSTLKFLYGFRILSITVFSLSILGFSITSKGIYGIGEFLFALNLFDKLL